MHTQELFPKLINTQIPMDGTTEAADLHSDEINQPIIYPVKMYKEMATDFMFCFEHYPALCFQLMPMHFTMCLIISASIMAYYCDHPDENITFHHVGSLALDLQEGLLASVEALVDSEGIWATEDSVKNHFMQELHSILTGTEYRSNYSLP